jgi:hypothetical protein
MICPPEYYRTRGRLGIFNKTNNELLVAQRYAKAAEGTILSNNPELILAQRHFQTRTSLIDKEFLANNPEIKVHLRYLEVVGR